MFSSSQPSIHYHITLLRHGESVGNAEGKHQGQSEFPLTELGKKQARALANRWQSENRLFDLIITSPLSRALQTAEILSETLHLKLEINDLWMERNNGVLAGLSPEEASQAYPRPPFIHPYFPIGQTGESQFQLYLRAGNAVQDLLNHPPGHYLVVSHGGILNMVLYAILGIAPQANFYGPRFRFGNTAFATLSYNPSEHKWYIHGINDQLHWRQEEQ
jgi:broad specificity phosphatase PhoE